ncbi:HCMVUS5 [Human betaherpesvirus 5]|uniref:Uncharacterized protein US5 n=1 Tax=Human cytomegalovirus (strain AD169) TaxID=10360 RepID=US05_HCMVA|nr:RecName: Full=Uncharacterized protein US5 [Human herpesvirus 5 strain AD169]CAA35272.1 HCMVUS5 [Human betaherpesvirus 5]
MHTQRAGLSAIVATYRYQLATGVVYRDISSTIATEKIPFVENAVLKERAFIETIKQHQEPQRRIPRPVDSYVMLHSNARITTSRVIPQHKYKVTAKNPCRSIKRNAFQTAPSQTQLFISVNNRWLG